VDSIVNIYQRINEVRKEVKYIQKDSDVQKQYKAVSHDAVTAAIHDQLINHGIIIIPGLIGSRVADSGTFTGKGVPIIRYEAEYQIDFVNMEKPEDKVSIRVEAHANDQGDKAPGKAISYATKYAMLKLFSIETGEDDESRDDSAKGPAYTPEQYKGFLQFMNDQDSLGMYLFLERVGVDVSIALYNSFPKGKKTANKQMVDKLKGQGLEIYNSVIGALVDLNSGILLENIEDCKPVTIRMLKDTFNAEQESIFNDLTGDMQ
jgi:hypothetical protein